MAGQFHHLANAGLLQAQSQFEAGLESARHTKQMVVHLQTDLPATSRDLTRSSTSCRTRYATWGVNSPSAGAAGLTYFLGFFFVSGSSPSLFSAFAVRVFSDDFWI